MFNSLCKFFITIYYLKPIQVVHLIKSRLKIKSCSNKIIINQNEYSNLKSFYFFSKKDIFDVENFSFKFLNKVVYFKKKIDWNYFVEGKLWIYNLNYFEYLNQENLSIKQKLNLLKDFSNDYHNLIHGREPYPTSLRIINIVKFYSTLKPNDDYNFILKLLKDDIQYLSKNLEYHLMGNHLLENAIALTFGAHIFQNKKLIKTSLNILSKQINEQILDDGAHYELSTMYHIIIMSRLMELLSLINSNTNNWNNNLRELIQDKISLMFSWMIKINNYKDIFPRLNDSVEGISVEYQNIYQLMNKLKIKPKKIVLNESGIRTFNIGDNFIIVDIADINPSFQPGHSHADTFNFLLYNNDIPIIVDPGISTYDNVSERHEERSTKFHNTVVYDSKNSSEVWAAFRVGRRAKVLINEESEKLIDVSHNGYNFVGVNHRRIFKILSNGFKIIDNIDCSKRISSAYIHFHPSCNIQIQNNNLIKINNCLNIEIKNDNFSVELIKYNYPLGYNSTVEATKLKIDFVENLITTYNFT